MTIKPLRDRLRSVEDRYSRDEERPLGSYAILVATYGTLVAGMVGIARAHRARMPERLPAADLALLTVGVFRASRLITMDSVLAVGRAPFTRFEEAAGGDEVSEEVEGHGLQHAVGELISCPFCLSVWLASVGMFGMITFPRTARMVCSTLAVVAGSDVLQYAHAALKQVES